uniref:Uncharacterized protein n=1 Tax=Anopheles braziliensis TaxID=58242 RepID=A0A2M3ZLJ8_9DIPT
MAIFRIRSTAFILGRLGRSGRAADLLLFTALAAPQFLFAYRYLPGTVVKLMVQHITEKIDHGLAVRK